ncbi:MAG: HlyD family efflux transporter periplasmic adaptor subunit [Phycisphaerales bacterium]|nr:HlyD family efflux transporter periplasmic adaptor subunit [Phycisphaerales bacterium]
MFVRKYVIPVLAVAGVAAAVYTVRSESRPVTPAPPVAEPASSPFNTPVAGAGIVEASTQNIAIGTQLAGIVSKVYVVAGAKVTAGDPLFSIDARALSAELEVREAALASAQQNLARMRALPRPEDVPPAEAKVKEMTAMLEDARNQFALMSAVEDPRAVSQDALAQRRFAVASAEARLAQSKADLDLLKAGAWKPDLAIAEANVRAAAAQVATVKTDLDRLTVRAPVNGDVLQVNVRLGEFANVGPVATPLMLMGDTDTLHIRVDIDENDAWRITPNAKATAFVRGNKQLKTDLKFVRIEPYVVPKRSLTGDSSERVDTRVLQVLYSFPRERLPVYVGQQMDVFIDGLARPTSAPASGSAAAAPEARN